MLTVTVLKIKDIPWRGKKNKASRTVSISKMMNYYPTLVIFVVSKSIL